MKKYFYLMVTAIMVLGFTACSDNDDNPIPVVVTDDKPFDYEQDMDLTVRPGDDFYRYVLGTWLDSDNPSPSMNVQIQHNMDSLQEKAVKESTDPLMATVRQQLEQALADDSKSVALLKERLAMLEQVETADQLYAAFATLHQLGYNPLFSVKISADEGRKVVGVFTTGGMDLNMNSVMMTKLDQYVEQYTPMYCKFLSIVGYSEERIQQITANAVRVEKMEQQAFRTSLSFLKAPKPVFTRRASDTNEELLEQIYSLMGMDYHELKDKVEVDNEMLVDLFSLFASAAHDTDAVKTLRDYMIYKVMNLDAYLIPSVTPTTKMFRRGISAISPLKYYTYQIMTETIGRENIYRDECLNIMEQMRQLFIERIEQLDWMGDATKAEARKKAESMIFFIGYPDEWNETMHPQTNGTFLLETVTQIRQHANKIALQLAGKSLTELGWNYWLTFANFTTDNACYSPNTNALLILPSWLMEPRFDATKNEATLYACATTFGHEFCHGFDARGSLYDADGNNRDWWQPEDKAAFEAKQQQLITLYNQLEAFPGQLADGEKTLRENMADLGGIVLTLELYKRHLQQQGFQSKEMDDQIRKFFIAYARVWQLETERSLELLQQQYQTDTHSASHTRINGMMRLQDEWYRLYDVQPTDKLYLAPEQRVKIW